MIMKFFATPILESIDWVVTVPEKQVANFSSYHGEYDGLTIILDLVIPKLKRRGWQEPLEFITYRNFIVKLGDLELLGTGNPYLVEACLAYYFSHGIFIEP